MDKPLLHFYEPLQNGAAHNCFYSQYPRTIQVNLTKIR